MAIGVTLPGSKRTLLPNARPAGASDPSEIAGLTIRSRSTGRYRGAREAREGASRTTARDANLSDA
jgi:hypothetical protein